ncbi:erythromycin esterase family protein [Streptomyces sp. FH025]|uniref:erythromycin esterase family protein n=1 Tax=Streptomyces sp. FH025 TaxID=2815937 RepID=UPI001A9D6AED|nr:erythromycin esterase family protein [Streptomyces sp. FH025]MBO1420309.1 erythromycin esterase family protein [Streptomyces sp. FH025]
MSQDIRDFLTPSCELLALGEPTHQEPAFGLVRNELFARLVGHGFRSIALETDRVAALAVNRYVQGGAGTLDAVLSEGFSHGFGAHQGNRQLVAWMREFNRDRAPGERLALHGFDAPTENTTAPSPRSHLEHARDYLRLDLDIAALTGEDSRWDREEAVLDAASSPGATPEADRLRRIADDLLVQLHYRAAELIEESSHAAWLEAATYLSAGLGLLRYHGQAAVRGLTPSDRLSGLLGLRDALMAQNLLDIRAVEARRGPTLLFSHNRHLQASPSTWALGELDCRWNGAGRIVGSLLGDRYAYVAGSLGRSAAIGLADPASGTYEAVLQRPGVVWEVTAVPTTFGEARSRTGAAPERGYFPLDRATLAGAAALLHIGDGAAAAAGLRAAAGR